MVHDPILTADDLIRTGACHSGVRDALYRIWKSGERIPSAMALSSILPLLERDEKRYARRAAQVNGDGEGYGSGYGDGSGVGYGDDDGEGDDDE